MIPSEHSLTNQVYFHIDIDCETSDIFMEERYYMDFRSANEIKGDQGDDYYSKHV